MRAPPPPNRHRDHHYTLHNSSNIPAPWTKRTPNNISSQPPPPPIAQTTGLQLPHLQKGHNVEAPPSHIQMDKVFTLRAPCDESTMLDHDAPNGETDDPRVPPSCPSSTGEDFRPNAPRLSPAHGHGSIPPPVSSTNNTTRRGPKHNLGAATSTGQSLWP
jgi:hypothetical protein